MSDIDKKVELMFTRLLFYPNETICLNCSSETESKEVFEKLKQKIKLIKA